MNNIFIDTDIILDFLIKREPFIESAREIFRRAEKKGIHAFVSSLSFSNLFYILRKALSQQKAISVLSQFRLLVTVLSVDEDIIDAALASSFSDFEDAIQYYTAQKGSIPLILTRNIKHYKNHAHSIEILSPNEYVSRSN